MNKELSKCCSSEVRQAHGCDADFGHQGKCDCLKKGGVTCCDECTGCDKPCETMQTSANLGKPMQNEELPMQKCAEFCEQCSDCINCYGHEDCEKHYQKDETEQDASIYCSCTCHLNCNLCSCENEAEQDWEDCNPESITIGKNQHCKSAACICTCKEGETTFNYTQEGLDNLIRQVEKRAEERGGRSLMDDIEDAYNN